MKFTYEKLRMPICSVPLAATSLAVVIAAVCPALTQEDISQLLYKTGAKLGYLPYNQTVLNSVVSAVGFEKINRHLWDFERLEDYVAQHLSQCPNSLLLLRYAHSSDYGHYGIALNTGMNVVLFSTTDKKSPSSVDSIYAGNRTRIEAAISELIKGVDTEALTQDTQPQSMTNSIETRYFKYFQPNPQSRRTGDCVIRAFCAVLEKNYGAVLALLEKSLRGSIDLNYGYNFMNLLLDAGFERVRVPRKGKRVINGIELCQYLEKKFPEGNCKAFAFPGRNHVAAVLPYACTDGKHYAYRYHDSWDSTVRTLTDLFICVGKATSDTQIVTKPAVLTNVTVGIYLQHPAFGHGQIASLTPTRGGTIVSVAFESGVKKNMMAEWLLEHCTIAENITGC